MAEAWMIRRAERQKLLEEFMRMVFGLEDEKGRIALFEMVGILFQYFQAREENLYNDFLLAKAMSVHGEVYELVFNKILPKIESFVRAPEEADVLVADLLKKIIDLALVPIYSRLMRLEISNPQLIFGVPSAMTQQELPDEEWKEGER